MGSKYIQLPNHLTIRSEKHQDQFNLMAISASCHWQASFVMDSQLVQSSMGQDLGQMGQRAKREIRWECKQVIKQVIKQVVESWDDRWASQEHATRSIE